MKQLKWKQKFGRELKFIVIAFISLISVISFSQMIKTENIFNLTGSVFMIPAFIGVMWLFYHTEKIWEKRLMICSGILGILFSAMLVIGSNMYMLDSGEWGNIMTYVWIVAGTPFWTVVVAHVIWYWDEWMNKIRSSRLESWCHEKLTGSRRMWLITWAIMFVCWIPALLAHFPGIYAYDSIFQVDWYVNNEMSGHHPILHTYILGWCITFGKNVLGSYEAGMLLYSILQMLVMSGIFAYIIKKLAKKMPSLLLMFCAACFALIPYNALFAISSTKDVVFGALFGLVVLQLFEIVSDMESFFRSKKAMVSFVVLVFLMCAFRNNGFYALLCMIPIMFIVCRKYWKQVLLISLACIFVWQIYTKPVYNLLGVQPGSKAEMMSVPMQQLARAVLYDEEKVTEEQKAEIREWIPNYERYLPRVSDGVKDTFNGVRLETEMGEFLRLWIEVGLKCPGEYLNAFASMNFGYWYPDMIYPDPGTYFPYIETINTDYDGDYILVQRHSLIPALEEIYSWFENGVQQYLPIITMLFSPGFMFWVICIGIVICIYRKRYEMAVPFSLLIGLWITLLLAPLVLLRYAYGFMVCMPVVLAMCTKQIKKCERGNEDDYE